jgi:hypothetical protein
VRSSASASAGPIPRRWSTSAPSGRRLDGDARCRVPLQYNHTGAT